MRRLRVFAGMTILSVVTLASAAPAVLTPGMWEITIRTELPEALPAMTTVVCISKEEAEDLQAPQGKASDPCRTTEGSRSGNILSYTTKCAGNDDHSKVRFTYDGERFEGVVEGKGKGRDRRQVYSGRRIGECEQLPSSASR